MSPFRILVADDHELMRKAVRALLEWQAEQQVIGEASTGAEAIGQVASLEPDLLILDLAMPELDGLEVAVRLQQSHPQTRMILLTGNATPALERQALSVGICRCISKSSPPRELIEAVTSLRSDHQGRISALHPPRASHARNHATATQAKKQSAQTAQGPAPGAQDSVAIRRDAPGSNATGNDDTEEEQK